MPLSKIKKKNTKYRTNLNQIIPVLKYKVFSVYFPKILNLFCLLCENVNV